MKFYFFLLFLLPLPVAAENILDNSVCSSAQSNLGPEIEQLRKKNLFRYMPNSSVEDRQRQCLPRNTQLVRLAKDSYDAWVALAKQPLPRSMQIAKELTKEIKGLVEADLLTYQRELRIYKECARILRDNPVEKNLSKNCTNFKEKIVPMLNQRLKSMRISLAMALNKSRKNIFNISPHEFQHPLFASTNSAIKLEPLTDDERESVIEGPDSKALQAVSELNYVALISQSPILLHFKGPEATPDELVRAFEVPPGALLESQAKMKDQDYILYNEYLAFVLKKVPVETRGDYCLVASELQKNYPNRTTSREQTEDVLLATELASMLLTRGLAAVSGSIVFFSSLSALNSYGNSYAAAKDFERGMQICQIAKYTLEDNKKNELCDFNRIKGAAEEAENSLFLVPLYGSPAVMNQFRSENP